MRAIFNFREAVAKLVEDTERGLRGRVYPEKTDMVEVYPTVAIYVEEADIEPLSMSGGFSADVDINVSVYKRSETLAAELADTADRIGKAVFANRNKWPDGVRLAYVSRVSTTYLKDSRGQEGALNLTITAQIQANY